MSTRKFVLETLVPDYERAQPLTAETFKDLIHEADEVERKLEEKIQRLNDHIDDQEQILESRANTIEIYERVITKYETEIEDLDRMIKRQQEREQLRDHSDRYDDLHRDQRDEERDFERSLEQLEDLS